MTVQARHLRLAFGPQDSPPGESSLGNDRDQPPNRHPNPGLESSPAWIRGSGGKRVRRVRIARSLRLPEAETHREAETPRRSAHDTWDRGREAQLVERRCMLGIIGGRGFESRPTRLATPGPNKGALIAQLSPLLLVSVREARTRCSAPRGDDGKRADVPDTGPAGKPLRESRHASCRFKSCSPCFRQPSDA